MRHPYLMEAARVDRCSASSSPSAAASLTVMRETRMVTWRRRPSAVTAAIRGHGAPPSSSSPPASMGSPGLPRRRPNTQVLTAFLRDLHVRQVLQAQHPLLSQIMLRAEDAHIANCTLCSVQMSARYGRKKL